MNADREQRWVEKARLDPQALKHLYNHYFPRLYAYVSFRVGRVQDAEDLVAETFLKVVGEIGRFEWRHEGSFAAWLFRIAHNLISNFYRQDQRWEEPVPLEELPELQANTLPPEDVILQKEKFVHLRRLIGTLSSRRQEVITLKFFGRLRNQEIAKVLGLDERTVASHLCRGLEDLHRKYVDEFIQTQVRRPQ